MRSFVQDMVCLALPAQTTWQKLCGRGQGPAHRECGIGLGTAPQLSTCPPARRAQTVFWSSLFATVSAELWSCFASSLQHKPKTAVRIHRAAAKLLVCY